MCSLVEYLKRPEIQFQIKVAGQTIELLDSEAVKQFWFLPIGFYGIQIGYLSLGMSFGGEFYIYSLSETDRQADIFFVFNNLKYSPIEKDVVYERELLKLIQEVGFKYER